MTIVFVDACVEYFIGRDAQDHPWTCLRYPLYVFQMLPWFVVMQMSTGVSWKMMTHLRMLFSCLLLPRTVTVLLQLMSKLPNRYKKMIYKMKEMFMDINYYIEGIWYLKKQFIFSCSVCPVLARWMLWPSDQRSLGIFEELWSIDTHNMTPAAPNTHTLSSQDLFDSNGCLCVLWGEEDRPTLLLSGTELDRDRTRVSIQGGEREIQILGNVLPQCKPCNKAKKKILPLQPL